MIISIDEFISSGTLGPIMLGHLKQDVHAMLGHPEDESAPDETPLIWKYGDLQLTFVEERLILIAIYFREPSRPKLPLTIDNEFPNGTTTLNEYKGYLQRQGIDCSIDLDLTFGSQTCIVSGVATSALFDTGIIDSLQVSSHARGSRRLAPC
jgi:hypothetical protein